MQPARFDIRDDFRRHRTAWLGVLLAFAVWGVVDVRERARRDPAQPDVHMTDLTVYTEAGAAFFDGRDPYRVTNDRGWSYLYPPLFAMLLAPLHPLASTTQALVWFGISTVLAFGCYVESRHLARAFARGTAFASELPGVVPRWVGYAALAAILLPALNCLQRGQVGVLKLYLLLLGCRLVWDGRRVRDWCLAGVVLSSSIVLKLTPALPVGCLLFALFLRAWSKRMDGPVEMRLRAWSVTAGVAAGCVLFFLILPASLIGWNENVRHLRSWYQDVVVNVNDVREVDFGHDVSSIRNQSLQNAMFRAGNWLSFQLHGWPDDRLVDSEVSVRGEMPMDDPVANRALHAVRLIVLAILLLLAVRVAATGDVLDMTCVFGLACVATLVVSPVSRGHYFVLMLPALLSLPAWFHARGWRTATRWAALGPVGLSWMHYLFLDWTGRLGVLGIGTLLWYLGISLWMARASRGPVSPDRPAPVSGHAWRSRTTSHIEPFPAGRWTTLTQSSERA